MRACSLTIMRKIWTMFMSFWPWSPRAWASMRATSKGWFQHASAPVHAKQILCQHTPPIRGSLALNLAVRLLERHYMTVGPSWKCRSRMAF